MRIAWNVIIAIIVVFILAPTAYNAAHASVLARNCHAGSVSDSGFDSSSTQMKVVVTDSAETNSNFFEAEFIYVPPIEPEPATPLFHSGSFRYIVGSENRPVATRQKEILIPADKQKGAKPDLQVSAEKVTPVSLPTLVVSPSKTPVATLGPTQTPTAIETTAPTLKPTATPTALPTATRAQRRPSIAETSVDPAVDVAREDDVAFYPGEFTYVPPPVADIEDPRFYRGSFSLSQTDSRTTRPPVHPGSLMQASANKTDRKGHEPASVPTAIPVLLSDTTHLTYYENTPLPARGKAMYYNPGIMQAVLNYRQNLGQVSACPECTGYVALLRSGDLNRRVWIEWPDGSVEGPFLVIDVAARHHVQMLLARNWVVDVDFRTAQRHGMNNPMWVTILDGPSEPRGFDFETAVRLVSDTDE